MLLTPPDIISQILLAVPVWLLFEVGLLLSKLAVKQRSTEQDNNRFRAMTDEEMDLELDEIELLESDQEASSNENSIHNPSKEP